MMSISESLRDRAGSVCELCQSNGNLVSYIIPPLMERDDNSVVLCENCFDQISGAKPVDPNHWRCLNNTMWSTVPAVQIMAWRVLHSLRHEGWPQDLLDMLYLDDETLAMAKAAGQEGEHNADEHRVVHKDSNGAVLQSGDTVTLIKDLDVKGGGFTAKRGTAVRGISLVENNPEQIEGKVNGQQIVILTKFVKKST